MTASKVLGVSGVVCMFALMALCDTALAQGYARGDDGWRDCADEGQTCRVDGRAVVRYGADDRWSSRVVNGSVECGNGAFGDPAPQTPKRCSVRDHAGGGNNGNSHGRRWTFCAAEGEVCRFRGQAEVRFGTGNRFTTRSAYGQVRCDVDSFGDPFDGVTKHCEVRSSASQGQSQFRPVGDYQDWVGNSALNAWRYCAPEGSTCNVNGRAEVRFGDGRRFASRTVNGEVACEVSRFGDPAPHVIKHCEVRSAGWSAGSGGGRNWSRCAGEGERCDFDGRAQVRYGASGRYAYRDAYNGLNCDTETFGTDPYDGRVKTCEVRR